MWSLALASLAVLTVAVDCACPRGYEPLNKTMRRLTMSGPMTWREVDEACINEFGISFQMLDRDFLFLSLEDKALCRGNSVPLRLSKKGSKPVVWMERKYLAKEEEVTSTYLTHMRDDEVPPMSAGWQVGSLDLSIGQWRLVDNSSTFVCAICQRAWVDTFKFEYKLRLKRVGLFPPYRPPPFSHVYRFRLVETSKNRVGLDEALHLAEKRFNQTRKYAGNPLPAKISRVSGEVGVENETSFRLKSTWWTTPDDVLGALNGSYSLESWQDVGWCPATPIEGLYWNNTLSGEVGEVRLQDSHVATRWCSWRVYPDGDWDAVWEDQVLLWIDRERECRARNVAKLLRRLHDYSERINRGSSDLKSLVDITADAAELDLPHRDWQPYIDGSRAIVGALSSLLVANSSNVSSSNACQGNACALFVADPAEDDELYSFRYSRGETLQSFINLNNQTSFMSVQFPQALPSAGHFSVHSWGDVGEFDKSAMTVQVVSSRIFNESEPEKSRSPVTFHVKNTDNNFFGWYHTVFSLGESEDSTLPCPLVRSEGSVYTYMCNKWERGPRNFTAGTFIANSHKDFDPLHYELFLRPVLIGYTTIPLDESALSRIATFTTVFLGIRNEFPIYKVSMDTLNPWQEILSGVVLTEAVFTAILQHVKVLVSDLDARDPAVSLSFGHGISRNDVSAKSAVDLVLGGDLQEHCKQLAILAVSGVADFDFKGSLGTYIKKKLMLIYLVVSSKSATEENSGNVYFEIQLPGEIEVREKNMKVIELDAVENYDVDVGDEIENEDSIEFVNVVNEFPGSSKQNQSDVIQQRLRFQVATWNEADGDWSVSSCAKRRSTRASKKVFRCKSLTLAKGAFRGKFLVFEPVRFAEVLGPTFLAILISAGVLSGVSLAGIASTAAFLPAWRKDLGHKILLLMAMALSCNLALGFTSSFVSVDTASVSCVAVGALRHFSYLAMFAWMLVMSGLQLRRLLSVLGARSTSNLLLKVSFFAWGLPTIAVGSLLIFKLDMYQSDEADRGYCYPEGTAFMWSVQAPAATVLTLNAFIFVVILARLYGFLGWGKTADLRRHLNERAFQIRRLRAVFFTFFLFGLTWLFHLLAEQGVFQTKFLYEYLFLMTASVHVFSLSCIFVFFDPEARAEWAQVVAPVTGRLGTWIVELRGRIRA